jgi:hypothetical protein
MALGNFSFTEEQIMNLLDILFHVLLHCYKEFPTVAI